MDIEDKIIKLATLEARRYAQTHHLLHMLDDIQQEAYLLLCEYVQAGKEMKPSFIRAHLRRRIGLHVWFGVIDIPGRYRTMSPDKRDEILNTASFGIAEGINLERCDNVEISADSKDPEEETSAKEIIERGLDKLSSAEHKLIEDYCNDIPLRDQARKEGVSPEAMRLRRRRAMEKMK